MKRWVHCKSTTFSQNNEYEINGEGDDWYVCQQGSGEIISGPFNSYDEARKSIRSVKSKIEEMHPKFLLDFTKYCRNLKDKFFDRKGRLSSYNKTALVRLVDSFMNKQPEADLLIDSDLDSEGRSYYYVH